MIFEADSPSAYPASHRLRKLTARPYTPVFVFLDAKGEKVLETAGFRNPREARALHAFVATKRYTTMKWEDFLAGYPGK